MHRHCFLSVHRPCFRIKGNHLCVFIYVCSTLIRPHEIDIYLLGGIVGFCLPKRGNAHNLLKSFVMQLKEITKYTDIYYIYTDIHIYIHFKLFLDKNDSTHKSAESNRNLNHEDPKDDPSSPSVSIVSAKALLVQAFNKSSTVLGGVKPMSFKAPSRGIFCDHSFSTPMCASAVITMASDKYTMAVARAVARLRFNCNNI